MTTSNERLNASLRILRRILERGGLLTRDELLSEFTDEESGTRRLNAGSIAAHPASASSLLLGPDC